MTTRTATTVHAPFYDGHRRPDFGFGRRTFGANSR
jgi:hypothetical protein